MPNLQRDAPESRRKAAPIDMEQATTEISVSDLEKSRETWNSGSEAPSGRS